ncbi:hypothetical protein BDZ94DRAFT_1267053 [Collybia nuda]|uniref:Uncharacterized protein n=1 Tax=Collybia nuda TaxID=64659 RepID=A0A9P6CF79_9AGAR|nr:hypothetical protein BDZ94DRAFT_1267053 [Collybia nuda]
MRVEQRIRTSFTVGRRDQSDAPESDADCQAFRLCAIPLWHLTAVGVPWIREHHGDFAECFERSQWTISFETSTSGHMVVINKPGSVILNISLTALTCPPTVNKTSHGCRPLNLNKSGMGPFLASRSTGSLGVSTTTDPWQRTGMNMSSSG